MALHSYLIIRGKEKEKVQWLWWLKAMIKRKKKIEEKDSWENDKSSNLYDVKKFWRRTDCGARCRQIIDIFRACCMQCTCNYMMNWIQSLQISHILTSGHGEIWNYVIIEIRLVLGPVKKNYAPPYVRYTIWNVFFFFSNCVQHVFYRLVAIIIGDEKHIE